MGGICSGLLPVDDGGSNRLEPLRIADRSAVRFTGLSVLAGSRPAIVVVGPGHRLWSDRAGLGPAVEPCRCFDTAGSSHLHGRAVRPVLPASHLDPLEALASRPR